MTKTPDLACDGLLAKQLEAGHKAIWLIDENWPVDYLPAKNSFCLTNRFDIFQFLEKNNIAAKFSDFENPEDISASPCFIRIGKEKYLNHHLLNTAKTIAGNGHSIFMAGYEKEGFKSLLKRCKQQGFVIKEQQRLKKGAFLAELSCTTDTVNLDDNNYSQPRQINDGDCNFYSKPGVFGWEKVDSGSVLLFKKIISLCKLNNKTVLDLGCGYGYLSMQILEQFPKNSLTATDNNAAAVSACVKNLEVFPNATVLPSDAANTINTKFDLVVCNPPFHRGLGSEKNLTEKFLSAASTHLENNGEAWFVFNVFLGVEKQLAGYFSSYEIICSKNGFKVIRCLK